MNLKKILIFAVSVLIILFILSDLLLSDFGPGETQESRLGVIAIFLGISVLVLIFLKKKL